MGRIRRRRKRNKNKSYCTVVFFAMINDGGVNDPIKSKMKFVFSTDNPFGKEEKVMAGSLQMDDATMRDLRDEFHSGYIENNGAFDQSDRRFLRQQDITFSSL